MELQTSEAFLRAFETADCETLNKQIRDWFEKPYRTPDNTIDAGACLHSALTAALTAREIECRSKWRIAEADRWVQARQRLDAGMRAFLEAVSAAPKSEPYQGEQAEREASQPAIGRGWHVPKIEMPKRGRPPKSSNGIGHARHA